MKEKANVSSIDSVGHLRGQVIESASSIRRIVDECLGQVRRTQQWLTSDCVTHWKIESRKRDQKLNSALSDLQRARIAQPDADPRSFVDHNRAVRKAKLRREEADEKLRRIKTWTRKLEREAVIFRAQLQRIAQIGEYDLPRAARWLATLERHLQGYVEELPPLPTPHQLSEDEPTVTDLGQRGTRIPDSEDLDQPDTAP
jgi:hypothetical protein